MLYQVQKYDNTFLDSNMLLYGILLVLIGTAVASPFAELRSNFEFLGRDTNLDEPAYRLKDIVYPHNMHIDLDVYLEEAIFNGRVDIDLEVSTEVDCNDNSSGIIKNFTVTDDVIQDDFWKPKQK